jgi:hypothetical protein
VLFPFLYGFETRIWTNIFSQLCIMRWPLRPIKSGLLRQMTS